MNLVALPIVVPLLGAAVTLMAFRNLVVQRIVGVITTVAGLAAAVVLAVEVEANGTAVLDVGGWGPGVGIVLVADLMSVMFLVMSMVVLVLVQIFAIGEGTDSTRPHLTHPVYLVLAGGVAMAFLTGDLFNLFVAFEVMLISSYVLLTLGARAKQLQAGMTYIVINIVASTLFIVAIAFIYAATGTVNLAELSLRLAELPRGLVIAMCLVLLSVFAIKAALFPFYFWLPDSYPAAPTIITAVFAGLLTKVGVYALIRVVTLFDLAELRVTLLVVASVTMLIGGIGAISQDDVKRILSFHIISQVGYMVMGLALYSRAGLAAAVLFVMHQIPVKTVLFLDAALIERVTGTGALHRLGGLVRRTPVIAVMFAIPALSLSGIPPFSGFIVKLALVDAGMDAGSYAVVAAALVAGFLTLFSMAKIWSGVFWGVPVDPVPVLAVETPARLKAPPVMMLATAAMVAITLAVPLFGGGLYRLAERSADELLDPSRYVAAVQGVQP